MDTSNGVRTRSPRPSRFERDRRTSGERHFGTYGTNAGPELISGNQFISDLQLDVFGRGSTADGDPAVNIVATVRDDSSVSFVGGSATMRLGLVVNGETVDSETFDLEQGESRFAPGLGYTFPERMYGSDASVSARLTRVKDGTVVDEVTQSVSVPGTPQDGSDGDSGGDGSGGNGGGGDDDAESQTLGEWWGSLGGEEKALYGGGALLAGYVFLSGGPEPPGQS